MSLYKELISCPNIFTMESTFSGLDIGEHKGQHMKTSMFEEMGRDLCRTLLIYESIFIPKELEHIFGMNEKGGDKKDMNAAFVKRLQEDKELMAPRI